MTDHDELVSTLPEDGFLRVRIHLLRVQIEQVAAAAFGDTTGSPRCQNEIRNRLLALLPLASGPEWERSYGVVRLARYCYRRSSDVLHGRCNSLDLDESLVAEWERIARELTDLYAIRAGLAAEAVDE